MTAKQALREYIEELSEEEAAHVWDVVRAELACEARQEPLTADDIAAIDRARADVAAGRWYTLEEVEAELELAD